MLKEPDLLDRNKLLDCLVQLLTSPGRLRAMSAAAFTQAHPHAAEEIANRLVGLTQNRAS